MNTAQTQSEALLDVAAGVIAGGVDSPVRAGKAVGGLAPPISHARGSRIYDVDGRAYIDYLCAYGPVLLGHAHPGVSAAVREALQRGAVFGATHPEEVRLAQRIGAAMPGMERLRFVNTGTEACMSAVRVARAFTRRETIVRLRGCYHGHSDEMIFSAGASSDSSPTLACGVTRAAIGGVRVLPYNAAAAVESALDGGAVAAVILEPVAGNMGLILPQDGYLQRVRSACDRTGTLLIFDEVITGFRTGMGGAQARYRVLPDLTCIGKTLGGGLPIAAFGGRADVMHVLAPQGSVFQGGTFAGNPVCVAAAHAFLDAMEADPQFHARLERLARRLADGARAALAAAGLPYPVVQLASMVDFAFRSGAPPRDHAEAAQADGDAYARYYWKMLERGVFLPPSKMEVMFLTAAHSDADVDATIAAMRDALSGETKPGSSRSHRAFAAALAAPARADWTTLRPYGANFAVSLPGTPEHSHKTSAVSGEQIETDLWLLRTSNAMYVLAVTAYPVAVDVQRELGLDRDNFDKSVQATPTSQHDVSSAGVAGIDVVSESPTKRFRQRWFTDGHRAWGAVIAMPVGSFDDALANRFLNSYVLINPSVGEV